MLDAGVDMIIHCTFWNADGSKEYRPDLVARIVDDDRWVNPTLYGGMYTEIEGLEGEREREGRLSAGGRVEPRDVPRDDGRPARRHAPDDRGRA